MTKRWFFLFSLFLLSLTMAAQISIDMHSHALSEEFARKYATNDPAWDEGFPMPAWDLQQHLRMMDEVGIEQSLLSMPAPQPYARNAKKRAAACRAWNEQCAAWRNEYPDRFRFCATLPLPDVKRAIDEAIYALDVLKADGVKLATNSFGQYLGAPELDTLMSVLNERGAVVLLHPHRPTPTHRGVMKQTPLAMQEYLSETTRAVSNMITRNVLTRYPRLKVVVPHCGAYLPLAIPRMKALQPALHAKGMVGTIDFEANLAGLYYDLAGAHSPEVIKMMLTITTPDHILYGSDYPYVPTAQLKAQAQRMASYLEADPTLRSYRNMILRDNARALFGLPTRPERAAASEAEGMMVRLATIEVHPAHLEAYRREAQRVSQLSMEREPGVIALWPLASSADSCQFRVLEIYTSRKAYESHLQTEHFKAYKAATQPMVKQLLLEDVDPLSAEQWANWALQRRKAQP